MSNILKGIINEVSPHNYDSDWDYQDAVARSGKSRSSYRSQEDDTFDADVAYSKKMYQLSQKQKRDADHDRLATGTNEGDSNQTRMRMNDYYDLAEALQEKLKQAIKLGNKELIQKLNKERDDLDARVKKYGLMPESQLDEISNEKLGRYKTAAALDASKADSEGDYKRGNKRFSGIVKATKKQFANDTKKSGISQGINEFAPIKPPTAGAFGGNKDYGQPNSSRYIGGNKFVVGTTNNYVLTATIDKWGLEWDEDDEIWFLDSPGAAHIADASEGEIELPPPREQRNQIHDLVTDYLNARNSADLQKIAAYYGHSDDGEMATNESSEAPRFNSKQEVINHFVKNGKSAAAGSAAWERGYRGSSKKPIELKKPPQRSYHDDLDDKRYASIDENLGDQLKSTSLDALVQAKLAIEKQRQAEIDAWSQDFQKNTVQKAQQGLRKEFEPTPVAQPGEKHSVLKARLAQLNNAIQKQELLDKLVDRLERKGILTPAMQNDADTTMHVRYGAKDNYQSLNKKLDNAIQTLQSRLNVRKISGLKEVHDERDEYDNPRQGRDYGKGNLFVDPGSNEFKKEVHLGANDGELGRPKNLKGVSKALPADAFGRTTGKIPDSARPTSNPDPFPPAKILKNHEKWIYPPKSKKSVDEADMSRRGFLGNVGKAAGAGALAAAGLGGASNAQAFKGTISAPSPRISEDEAEAQIKELRNKAYKELASMVWSAWPSILDTTFGGSTPADKPATPEQIGKILGYRLAEYADDYRQKVRAIKIAAGVKDPQSLNKTSAAVYINEQEMDEGWSQKYKSSINCSHPKGFSQKAHCAGKKKHNESIDNVMEMTCPDCGMCETHGDNSKDQLDELKCWSGYHRVAGTKAGFPGSCAKNKTNEEGVAEEQLNELDFFAPVTTFIKMTDGSYIQADWRKSQGNPGLSDSASFVNFKPVNPNVAKQLGLDSYQRNNSISNHRDGTIVPGGPIQGSGPLANRGYEVVDYNKPETMKELPPEIKSELIKWVQKQSVTEESCPHCNGPMFSEMIMNEKKDACYYKVKSRYKVWPSAYASGALVKCRNKGASNWGNGGKKNESSILEGIEQADESLHDWFNKEKWVRMDTKGKIKGPCAREPGEGKPKCLPQSKAHSLGKKGRASAAQRKRREDPNPDRSGKAINVDTKKSKG